MLSYVGIYTEFADGHIRRCHKKGEMETLSRIHIEQQLLAEVDRAGIPVEQQVDWYKTVMQSPELEAYWTSISARYNLPEVCTVGFQNGQEDAEDDDEDELEAEEEHEEEKEAKDQDVESDDSSDWSSNDEDPRDHPLFLARVERAPKYCSVCHSKGHNDEEGARLHPEFDWNDWESDSSEGSVTKHKGKVYGKIMFVGLEQSRDEAVEDWLRRVELTKEDPCTAWSKINPRAEKEADTVAYEDSPYGCQCRHRVRSQPITNPPPHDLSYVSGALSAVSIDQAAGNGENGQGSCSSNAVGKDPGRTTAKSASKPRGVVKKTSAPPNKRKLPAQFELLEAATKPAKVSKNAEISDGGAGAYVSPPQERQGVKRTLEESREGDDDEGPLAKKAKIGGGVGAYVSPPQEEGQGVKRTLEESREGDDDEAPQAKKAKTGGGNAEGGRKIGRLKKDKKGKAPKW